jgi:hypothetical protein
VPGVPGVAGPVFVPWSQKLIEKPAKLVTKILDRLRCWQLGKKIKLLKLSPEAEKEILADLKFKDEVIFDFNLALADCATIELNKRRVPGSENSHWLNLAMCAGEMGLVHVQTLERIEKLVVADREKKIEREKAA